MAVELGECDDAVCGIGACFNPVTEGVFCDECSDAIYGPAVTGTEVTRPDGTRFVSRTADLDRLGVVYPAGEGYSLRLVTGWEVRPA